MFGFAFFAAAALAQDPAALFDKAPPDVDEALRARITKFYRAHVEGKFRAADAFVAEDSKDIFFAADKPRCRAFTIGSIKYSDNFTRAVVMVACDTEMLVPMAGPMPVKRPLRSQWKIVDGEWYWYLDPIPEKDVVTPFGISNPGPPRQGGGLPGMPAGAVDPQTVAKLVEADKTTVTFDASSPGMDRVVLTNHLPGAVSLSLEPAGLDWLDLKLDRHSLTAGQPATLSIRYAPDKDHKPSEATVRITVSPTQQQIPVQIRFSTASATPGKD